MLSSIYQIFSLLTSLALYPVAFVNKRYRKNLGQRYGKWNISANDVIWVHGASLGEISAAGPVIRSLREKYPSKKILISSFTETGLAKGSELGDFAALCPFDNELWYRRAFHKIGLSALLVCETEIWPGMLRYAASRKVPIYFINARISDYTYSLYKKIGGFLKTAFEPVSGVFALNEEAKERFIGIGVSSTKVSVLGYSKYDNAVPSSSQSGAPARFFTSDFPVLTLGSIRPGEEEIWFPAIAKALKSNLNINFVVAPRHLERTQFFADKLAELGISFSLFSRLRGRPVESEPSLLILDTMGELLNAYSASIVSFIGATLVNIGGHNPLEAAGRGSVVCIGPHFNNVRDVVDSLLSEGGALQINSSGEAFDVIKRASIGDESLKLMGQKAFEVAKRYAGAAERITQAIKI